MTTPVGTARPARLAPWLALAAAIAVADQLTKWLLARTIVPGKWCR